MLGTLGRLSLRLSLTLGESVGLPLPSRTLSTVVVRIPKTLRESSYHHNGTVSIVHQSRLLSSSSTLFPATSETEGKDPGGHEGQVEFTLQLTNEEMDELTKGDAELVKKVKYIQLEHEVYRQEGAEVPSNVTLFQWKELLALPSPGSRKRYYRFLFLNEMKRQSEQRKKEQRKLERLKELEESKGPRKTKEEDAYGIEYGLSRNTLSLRIYDTTINRHHYHKVCQAMKFGPPLVLDCGYDEFMNQKEARNCAKQVELMLSQNRSHNEPFDLQLCNAPANSKVMEYLLRINPSLYSVEHPLHITEKSYLDIFPREKLVYLSPHARDEMEEFDEDEIYIIGAMVDKSDPRPFSLAKAKKENIRMKKLPLDKYLVWGIGNKSLTINQMLAIMLDLKCTRGDWKKAFVHVPMRKLNRDFHPYPDQVQQQPVTEEELKFAQAARHESKSPVLEDYKLLNRRKGFRGFDTSARKEKTRYQVRFNQPHEKYGFSRDKNSSSSETGRINVRSLFDE